MSFSSKIKEYLDKEHIPYELLEHEPTFTAQEIAGIQHVPGQEVVKSVIVIADGEPIMCVLPAIHRIDFGKLKHILNVSEVHLADELQLAKLFPDCEVGAEPPFGHLYNLKIYADKILEENEDIAFNAGSHTEMLRIKYKDFIHLTHSILAAFGVHVARTEEQNWLEICREDNDKEDNGK